jgi:uncharacterized protein (TIGR03437 family)
MSFGAVVALAAGVVVVAQAPGPRSHVGPAAQSTGRNRIAGRAGLFTRQSFDTSGNATLNGPYFVRQVLVLPDVTTSSIVRAASLTGVMTFDGRGNYSFAGQLLDTAVRSTLAAYSVNGRYSVQSNGLLQLVNPIDPGDTEFGAVGGIGPNAIIASATEGQYNDIFVAIPAASMAGNGSVQGSYHAGFIDFLQGNASNVRDGYFTMTSNGSGSFGNVTIHGAMANQGSTNTTQTLSGLTYSISDASGSGTITFPTASNPPAALLSGQKTLYVSQDGNILLGGSNDGFDLIVAMKAVSSATNAMFNGTYFIGALEDDVSFSCRAPNCIDSFYGSTNANGQGNTISHLREVGFNFSAYDITTDATNIFGADGTFNDGMVEWLLGADGGGVIQVGTGQFYTLTVGFHAKQYSGSGVFLNPIGIVNSANFAPITNSVAPGEYVTLFGTGLASDAAPAGSVPLPTTLGGVQVMVNGVPAPLLYVSPNLISLQVPFSTPSQSYAAFKVVNNGVSSNAVTVYTAVFGTAPGVYTSSADGVGPGDVFHSDYSFVTAASPGKAGETLFLYATGLGVVAPSIGDGTAAPTNSLNNVVDQNLAVYIVDQNGKVSQAKIVFAGLAPGLTMIYQVNFTVPSGVASGAASLEVRTSDAFTAEAKIYIQ